MDAVALTKALIRCASVTPEEGGALVLLQDVLEGAGFACTRVDRGGIANLYARKGSEGPVLGFNGHTDVVPPGDPAAWTDDPFSGAMRDGRLWGRGAQDMKSGVAAFVAAACAAEVPGSIVVTVTGDEEGRGVDGTRAILDWMAERGERMDACLVGEPTCPESMGEMIKIGRRGSLTARIAATGIQGHAAYPHRALNPVHALLTYLVRVSEHELDRGTAHFDPSMLQVTTVDVGNPASNVIPARAGAVLNIRFNDTHTGASLSDWLRAEADRIAAETGVTFALSPEVSGEAFLTPPGPLSDLIAAAVEAETGRRPVLSTSGGTSDARFVKDHCPVVEVGLVGDRMHQVDESVPVDQVRQLSAIYGRIIRDFFA